MWFKNCSGIVVMVLFGIGVFSSCKHEIPLPIVIHPTDTTGTIPETLCDTDTVYFQNSILPIFVSNCAQTGCHNNGAHAGGIKLNNYSNIINTGNIQAFNPSHGKILDVITTSDPGDIMPPSGQGNALTQTQINMITEWINQGALDNFCNECDTTTVTYSKSIAPILTAKCKGCHQGSNPGGGISLVTYTDAFAIAQNGSFYGSVIQDGSFSSMPKGSKLPDCDIAKIRIWIAAGSPNN